MHCCGACGRRTWGLPALGWTWFELQGELERGRWLPGCQEVPHAAACLLGRVLDLGSGSGRDCYVCSALVGEGGSVTGVDMTPAQLAVARKYADEYCTQVRSDEED